MIFSRSAMSATLEDSEPAVWAGVTYVEDRTLLPGVPADRRGAPLSAPPASPAPVDLRIVRPRALDIAKLCALAGKPVGDEVIASLSGKIPILLCHGLTAFAAPGRSPPRLWGMGYEIEVDLAGDTIGIEPGTRFLEVARAQQTLSIGVTASGRLGVPAEGLAVAGSPLPVAAAEIHASTDQQFSLALQFVLRCVKVEAGPFGAGGAKWNMYVQDEPLNGFQALYQTLLIKDRRPALRAKVTTWVRTAGLFGFHATQWTSNPIDYDVDLDWS